MNTCFERLETDREDIKEKEYYDESYQYFLALDPNNMIIGALGYLMDDGIFSIEVLYVEPDFRGNQIAKQLLHRASDYAVRQKCTQVCISAILDYDKQDAFADLMLSQAFGYPEFGSPQFQIYVKDLNGLGIFEKEIKIHSTIQMIKLNATEIKDCKRLMADVLNPNYLATTIGEFEPELSYKLIDGGKNIIGFIIVSSLPNGDLYIDASMMKEKSYVRVFMRMLQYVIHKALEQGRGDNKLLITSVTDSSESLVERIFKDATYKKYINAATMKLV